MLFNKFPVLLESIEELVEMIELLCLITGWLYWFDYLQTILNWLGGLVRYEWNGDQPMHH